MKNLEQKGKLDSAICNNTPTDYISLCNMAIAIAKKDVKMCEIVENGFHKDRCRKEIAEVIAEETGGRVVCGNAIYEYNTIHCNYSVVYD